MPRSKKIQIGPERWLEVNLTEVAEQMGVSKSALSRIFNGQRSRRMRFCERLAVQLGITLDELMYAIKESK